MDVKYYLRSRFNSVTKQFEAEMYTNVANNVYMGLNSEKTVDVAVLEAVNAANNALSAANAAQTLAAGLLDSLGGDAGAVDIANQAKNTAASALTAATNAQSTANAALPKSGGTMTGVLTALNDTSYTTSKVRNIYATTTDLTAGSSSLSNGSICFVYE